MQCATKEDLYFDSNCSFIAIRGWIWNDHGGVLPSKDMQVSQSTLYIKGIHHNQSTVLANRYIFLSLCEEDLTSRSTFGRCRQYDVIVARALHCTRAPALLKVRPTMNQWNLLTLEVSAALYIGKNQPDSHWSLNREHRDEADGPLYGPHFPMLSLHLPVTDFSPNYFSFVQVSFF